MFKQKISLLLILAIGFVSMPNFASAEMSILSGFNPNKLIDDKVFADTQTFGGAAGIQKFLESKGSVLANTSESFLVKLKEPSNATLKKGLDDPNADSKKF